MPEKHAQGRSPSCPSARPCGQDRSDRDGAIVSYSDTRTSNLDFRPSALVIQTPYLTYRKIRGQYWITNPNRREVVVINEAGFNILRLCDRIGSLELYQRLKAQEPDSEYSALREFLGSLANVGLIRFQPDETGVARAKIPEEAQRSEQAGLTSAEGHH